MKESPRNRAEASIILTETMTAYADRTRATFLKEHINSARKLYEGIGLTDESFKVNAEHAMVQISFTPSERIQGSEGIVHGGALALLVDAASGALGSVIAGGDTKIFTQNHLGIRYVRPVQLNEPITVLATRDTFETDARTVRIKTVIRQKGKPVVIAKTDIISIS